MASFSSARCVSAAKFTINENVHLNPSARLFNNPVFVTVPSLCTSDITTLITLFGFNRNSTCIGSPFHAGFNFSVNRLLDVFSNLINCDGLFFASSNSSTSNSAR